MNDFIDFYLAISPVVIFLSVRALAVSRKYRRVPRVAEVFWSLPEIDEQDKRWLLLVRRFFIAWVIVVGVVWLKGDNYYESRDDSIKGIVVLSMFHLAYVSYVLRSIYFNVFVRSDGMSAKQENELYVKNASIFPGFNGLINSLISLSTIFLMVLFASLFLIGD